MSPYLFLENSIKEALEKDGYPPHAVTEGTCRAMDHYKRTPKFTRKGVFQDCYDAAYVLLNPIKKRTRKKKATDQLDLLEAS